MRRSDNAAIFFEAEAAEPADGTTLVAEWHQTRNGKIFARSSRPFFGPTFAAIFPALKDIPESERSSARVRPLVPQETLCATALGAGQTGWRGATQGCLRRGPREGLAHGGSVRQNHGPRLEGFHRQQLERGALLDGVEYGPACAQQNRRQDDA
jgi:hypothetical protein